jgi:hypothetical protein
MLKVISKLIPSPNLLPGGRPQREGNHFSSPKGGGRVGVLKVASVVPCFVCLTTAVAQETPANPLLPRIESVVSDTQQPHEKDAAVIWYDDFDGPQETQARYLEPKPDSPHAKRSDKEALGGSGLSMECFYAKGEQGIGNRKLVFGDCPFGRPIRAGEKFEDIYWRIYVKHQEGWQGNPDKMSRATGFVSNQWNQAFISHVWSSGVPLTLDPVRGVREGQVVTTKYNDFANFKWLGNSPKGNFPLHDTKESGRWVCIESRLKLNTPGQKDGYAALWVDGVLDAERKDLDLRGTYNGHGINAVFLEAYWNNGSPVDQYRWYDDFVVSTKPIGPLTAPPNPTLIKTRTNDGSWEVQIADDNRGTKVVWQSRPMSGNIHRLKVDNQTGQFSDAGQIALSSGPMYFCRIRQQDKHSAWSQWSSWHQPFLVAL